MCVDLYKLRVFYVTKEEDKFEKVLKHMLKAEKYRSDDRESFLETYFHTFLIKGNRKYADWILKQMAERREIKNLSITVKNLMR